MEKETATLIAAVIAAIASLVGAGLASWRAYRSSLLEVYAQTRSANRKTWMNRVIEVVRDLVVLCKHEPDESKALTRLVTELDMLLNPENVENKTPEAVRACRVLQTTLAEIRELRTEEQWHTFSEHSTVKLIQPVKVILAQEWKLVMEQR
jgi:hypothetical protein